LNLRIAKFKIIAMKFYSNNLNINNIRKYIIIIFLTIISTCIYSQSNNQKEIFLNNYGISIYIPETMDTIPNLWIIEVNKIYNGHARYNGGFYLTKNDYPFTFPYILYTYYSYDVPFLNCDNETRLRKLAKKYDFSDNQKSHYSYETEIGVIEFDTIDFGKPYIDFDNNMIYSFASLKHEKTAFLSYEVYIPLEMGFLIFHSYCDVDFDKNYKMFKDIFTSINIFY